MVYQAGQPGFAAKASRYIQRQCETYFRQYRGPLGQTLFPPAQSSRLTYTLPGLSACEQTVLSFISILYSGVKMVMRYSINRANRIYYICRVNRIYLQ